MQRPEPKPSRPKPSRPKPSRPKPSRPKPSRPNDGKPKTNLARRARLVGCAALESLLPRGCAACGAVGSTLHGFVCLGCLAAIEDCRSRERTVAPELGRAELVAAPYRYVDAIRELVLRVKFGGEPRLARALGWRLAEDVVAQGNAVEIDAVVPVPLARRRHRIRGFNQALEIAKPVAVASSAAGRSVPCLDRVLERVSGSGPQSRLGAADRQRNAVHAFEVRNSVEGMRILLVDDVVTTGSTLRACARALHHSGALCVRAAVVAVSPAPVEANRVDR